MKRFGLHFTSMAMAALCVVGCSSSDAPDMAEVTGTLTKDGQPFVNAQVEFYPMTNGAASYGVTDDEGNFVLRYSTGKPGAAVDKHKVSIIGGSIRGGQAAAAPGPMEIAGEDAVEGTLAPVGGPTPNQRSQNAGGPKTIDGLTADVVASGPNHIELSI
jgi:hypothetical protein